MTMERKEERIQASVAYNEQHGKLRVIGGSAILSDEEFTAFNKNPDFIAGATWSDENPKEGMVDINKVVEWLNNNVRNYVVIRYYPVDVKDSTLTALQLEGPEVEYRKEEFLNDFKKAME